MGAEMLAFEDGSRRGHAHLEAFSDAEGTLDPLVNGFDLGDQIDESSLVSSREAVEDLVCFRVRGEDFGKSLGHFTAIGAVIGLEAGRYAHADFQVELFQNALVQEDIMLLFALAEQSAVEGVPFDGAEQSLLAVEGCDQCIRNIQVVVAPFNLFYGTFHNIETTVEWKWFNLIASIADSCNCPTFVFYAGWSQENIGLHPPHPHSDLSVWHFSLFSILMPSCTDLLCVYGRSDEGVGAAPRNLDGYETHCPLPSLGYFRL